MITSSKLFLNVRSVTRVEHRKVIPIISSSNNNNFSVHTHPKPKKILAAAEKNNKNSSHNFHSLIYSTNTESGHADRHTDTQTDS